MVFGTAATEGWRFLRWYSGRFCGGTIPGVCGGATGARPVRPDVFVCQLSTNDATKGFPVGEVGDSFDINDFDTMTVAGAIQYIIAYAKQTWNCPIAFYTSPKYDEPKYEAMVELMYQIAEKWNIELIDLWTNDEINEKYNSISEHYKNDKIHPTKKGYNQWTPVFEKRLAEILAK